MDRAYLAWTPEEDAQLLAELWNGQSSTEIAKTHQRTKGAISSRQNRIAINFYKNGFTVEEISGICKMTTRRIIYHLEKNRISGDERV